MKKLILIPLWLQEALEANNHGVKDVIKEEIVRTTLSNDDVGFYIFLNNTIGQELSFGTFDLGEKAIGFSREFLEEFNSYTQAHVLNNNVREYEPRELLFGALFPTSYNDKQKISFEVIEINEDTIGIVPSYNEEGCDETQLKFKERLLTVLSKYLSFQELVKTNLFRNWLKTIS